MIDPPPSVPAPSRGRWQHWLTVLPMLAGTVATALMFGGREGASAYTYVVGGIFGVSTLGMLVTGWGGGSGQRAAEVAQARRDYLRHLAGLRNRVRGVIADQRSALYHRHPDPDALWAEAAGPRLWERRASDADFAVVRIGTGTQALATSLIASPVDPATDPDPVTVGALHRFLDAYGVVPGLPVGLALRSFRQVRVRDRASGEPARALVRAMVAQLVTFHGPDDLVVAACVAPDRRAEWEWLKWLPHSQHRSIVDGVGSRRLVATAPAELAELLDQTMVGRAPFAATGLPADPHLVVIADRAGLPEADPGQLGGPAGSTTVVLGAGPPGETGVLDRNMIDFEVDEHGQLHSITMDDRGVVGAADALTRTEAEALARRLAPVRLASPTIQVTRPTTDRDLAAMLRLVDRGLLDPLVPGPAHAVAEPIWPARPAADLLKVPIGTDLEGRPVHLDLKESALDGMGPHGLLIGATGSGKSELLRTLVLGLAATHPPDQLNLVLVDFKGGATFATLDRLPHTSALITNLVDELPLVDRMTDALNGELVRRQELLRRAGNLASVRDYEQARLAATSGPGSTAPAVPSLLIVCDEFSELLAAKPEFIELFVQIGRVGRSLGVHLLLASQRLDEGRLRGLETHLSYRIGLRTFSAMESRAVLGVPDAHELPRSPGHGYLKYGTEPLQRFQAAYVSGPYQPTAEAEAGPPGAGTPQVLEFTTELVPLPEPDTVRTASTPPADHRSLLDLVVDRLAGHGGPAHQVWLPPLVDPPTLDHLLGGVTVHPGRGLTSRDPAGHGRLRVPVALVDKPFEQRRDVAWLDLAGAAGHLAVVGAPQSGKSTAIRTVVTALALTHTPAEVQVYCLDFGGGSLATVRDLPQVGSVAGRLETAVVRRTIGELATLLSDRERRFASLGIDSMATFRRHRRLDEPDATVAVPEDGFGDVFLVVDGWATLRNEFEDLEPVIADLATRGLSYGVHLVAAATRWMDFRPAVRDLFGSRLELRLGDPADSMINRKTAGHVPSAPGRGLTADGAHLLVGLPQLGTDDPAHLVRSVAEAWPGRPAPAVRLLPALLPYSALLVPDEDGGLRPVGEGYALPLGIAESDLRPVLIDFATESHLVAYGDSESGKSTLLRLIGATLTDRCRPDQVGVLLVDYRRGLSGAIPASYLLGSCAQPGQAAELVEALVAQVMHQRQPSPDRLLDRATDSPPGRWREIFILVDDYDLVAGPANPLQALVPVLPRARDLGIHLVLTRRAGGAGRASYDPILQALRDLAVPGLVLSGDRSEGPLVGGVAPAQLPAGRGWLVTRRDQARLIQLALPPP